MHVYAHRGARLEATENSLEAFRLAAELGVDGIETDVQRTVDGAWVLMHDDYVLINESYVYVRQLTLSELKKSVAADVVLLDELLDDVGQGLPILLDIKQNDIAYDLAKKIFIENKFEHIEISSFRHEDIKLITQHYTQIKTSIIVASMPLRPEICVQAVGAKGISLVRTALTQRGIDSLQKAKIDIKIYTVNDINEAQMFKDMNINAVITDDPRRIMNVSKK
ncbi:MAG: glycerophosphoryl diester phosphodiesterase [Candidatus Omnitrophota bacterium]|jgi:glycerophosphoryl diester phosphodiesterase